MVIDYDTGIHQSKKITLTDQTTPITFREEFLEEHLAFFNGENTHSCIYLFNPRTKQEIENDLKLVNITQRQSSTFIQLIFNYDKGSKGNARQQERFIKTYTLSKEEGKDHLFNISYEI